eukprot:m.13932 g.13932  ORF g.13932 m.13932 type:complete len:352 (-) comp7676_c0_seq1:173-1228(-)
MSLRIHCSNYCVVVSFVFLFCSFSLSLLLLPTTTTTASAFPQSECSVKRYGADSSFHCCGTHATLNDDTNTNTNHNVKKGGENVVFVQFSKVGSTSARASLVACAKDIDYGFVDVGFMNDNNRGGRSDVRVNLVRNYDDARVFQSRFGMCNLLQGQFPERTCSYITLLRHPIDRLLSSYAFFCKGGAMAKRYWYNDKLQWKGKRCPDISVEEYAEMIGSIYTKDFSLAYACADWPKRGRLPFEEEEGADVIAPTENHLAAAMNNLKTAAVRVFTLTETMDEGWGTALHETLTCKIQHVPHRNTNKRNNGRADFTKETLHRIGDILHLDMSLYLFVERCFSTQTGKYKQGCA